MVEIILMYICDTRRQTFKISVFSSLQAVRLESARVHRIRYLVVVSATERESKNEMVLLGVDFPDER